VAVSGFILVAAPRAELQDALNMNVQSLQLLPKDALRHLLAEILYEETYQAIFGEKESVKTHTRAPTGGSEGIHSGPKAIGCPWHYHQFITLQLGRETAAALRP
jgi:hypothetical protein